MRCARRRPTVSLAITARLNARKGCVCALRTEALRYEERPHARRSRESFEENETRKGRSLSEDARAFRFGWRSASPPPARINTLAAQWKASVCASIDACAPTWTPRWFFLFSMLIHFARLCKGRSASGISVEPPASLLPFIPLPILFLQRLPMVLGMLTAMWGGGG